MTRKKALNQAMLTLGLLSFLIFPLTLAANTLLKDAYSPSPLKKSAKNSAVHELQNRYHEIYKLYKDSIVFISTEKTVKLRYNNPFMEDPFFKKFFKEKHKSPKTRKQRGLGTGFIISKDGYIWRMCLPF